MLIYYSFWIVFIVQTIIYLVILQKRLKTVSIEKNVHMRIKKNQTFLLQVFLFSFVFILATIMVFFLALLMTKSINIFDMQNNVYSVIYEKFKLVMLNQDTTSDVAIIFRQIINQYIFLIPVLLFVAYKYFMMLPVKRELVKKKASELGTHGTGDWEKLEEIFKIFGLGDKGIILGELNGRKLVHQLKSTLNQIITTFGGSGSGKTAGYVITNILNIIDNVFSSIVVTDPKGELYNKTSHYARKHGYKVLVVNLINSKHSMRKNPISHVKTATDAFTVAEMIVANGGGKSDDPLWSNAEMTLLASLMLYIRETQPPEKLNIPNVFDLGIRYAKNPIYLDVLFDRLPNSSEAKRLYGIFSLAAGNTRTSILVGFGTRLKLWASNEIRELTSQNDFDFSMLGKEKCILYILTSDSEKTFDLIPSLLLNQMFNTLYADANNSPTERLDVDVRVIGDEMANIARIEDLERKVSTMRSRGISIIPIFQNVTQFRNRYPDGTAEEILGSSDTIVYLGSNDYDTNKYFSEFLGKTTYITNSLNESENINQESEGQNLNTIGKNLIDPNEMTKILKDKVIIIQRGSNPILADKHFYYKQPQWSDLELTHSDQIPTFEYDPSVEINFRPLNEYITENYEAYIEKLQSGNILDEEDYYPSQSSQQPVSEPINDELEEEVDLYEQITGKRS